MSRVGATALVCAAFVAGLLVPRPAGPAQAADNTPVSPAQGWNLHIDAQKHFGDTHPDEIAHHWCKPVSNNVTECQIYSSDSADAQLVAVETIVGPAMYNAFSKSEQAVWHYHKDEIPKVNATLPGKTPAEAKQIVDSISNTYGKIWLLYDPMTTNGMPTGQPTITVLR